MANTATHVANTVASTTIKIKDGKPVLSSRNSTGAVSKAASTGLTVPARFSMADSRSLAAAGAVASGSNPWAEEIEAAKSSVLKKAKEPVGDDGSVTKAIEEGEE